MGKPVGFAKRTLIQVGITTFSILAGAITIGLLDKSSNVSASKNKNDIHMVAGEIVNYPITGKVKKVSSKEKSVIASASGEGVNLYSFKKGKDTVTIKTEKGEKKITAIVSENPIKGEIVNITKNSYGNIIAILKFENTDKEKTFENVELAYSLMTKPIDRVSKQAASGAEKVDVLRPREYVYLSVAVDKNNVNVTDIDKKKSSLYVSNMEESEDAWIEVSKMVKIENDVKKNVKKDFVKAAFTVRNADENATDNVVHMIFYDKDGNVSQVESLEYPCSGKTAREYQSKIYSNSSVSKTVDVKTQSFAHLDGNE